MAKTRKSAKKTSRQKPEEEAQVVDAPASPPGSPLPPPPPPPTPLERHLVGGPLLGRRPASIPCDHNVVSWDVFEPLITPEIVSDHRKNPERFILLPHARYISVLAYRTGVKVATLVPTLDSHDGDDEAGSEDNNVVIGCISLAKYPRKLSETTVYDVLERMEVEESEGVNFRGTAEIVEEVVVLVGCQDGSVREFSLKEVANQGDISEVDCGPYQVSGPCFRPRRVIQVLENKDPIIHLTAPPVRTQVREDGILLYVAARRLDRKEGATNIRRSQEKPKESNGTVTLEVHRVLVPHFDGSTNVTISDVDEGKQRRRSLDQFECKVGRDKDGKIIHTLPFKMISTAKPLLTENGATQQQRDWSIFVVLARANSISVYYEQLESQDVYEPMSFGMPSKNPLTAFDISVNKADITCGHYRGNIRVMNNVLNDIERYHITKAKAKQLGEELSTQIGNIRDPRSKTITSRVHWHALPVTTLVYDTMSYAMDPLLYSGGDESVLVTWQISQGKDRPADVQPRLALGGIVHLTCSDRCDENAANGILVYCEDNTLQLIESHNKGKIWKVQGLADGLDGSGNAGNRLSLEIDPRSDANKNSQLIISGMAQAPGYIHWFNPSRERLASTLEVAPFNRISRTEPDELPPPTPTITCHAFSKNGDNLVTIDEYPTENPSLGVLEKQKNGEEYGVISTIRFWSWNDSVSAEGKEGVPLYKQVASMTFPHGPKHRISALGISRDGSIACTVSHSEKVFRVWEKRKGPLRGLDSLLLNGQAPSWTCRYKVTVPAGLSNQPTMEDGVSFSEDGSILAISFGQSVTLWDSNGARLLTSFKQCFGETDIELVRFVNPGLHQDLLLVQSCGGVSLRSPYGKCGSTASFTAWEFPAPAGSIVTAVDMVDTHACVAISLFFPTRNKSQIILVDVATGKEGINGDESNVKSVGGIDGCVRAICALGKRQEQSNWGTDGNRKSAKPLLALYALSSTGELLLFTEKSEMHQRTATGTTLESSDIYQSAGPRLDMIGTNDGSAQKRKRTQALFDTVLQFEESTVATKKMALDIFGLSANENGTTRPSTAELPSLSGNFVKAFVGRNLARNSAEQRPYD